MPPSQPRRFSIGDIMVLVAAAAVGALFVRFYAPERAYSIGALARSTGDPWSLGRIYAWGRGPGSCFVVPLTAAAIALRLRQPLPRRARLVTQPGFVACLAVLASLLPGLAWMATIYHRPGFRRPIAFELGWAITTQWADTAVLGAWIALALSRRWRPEPSWIDRLGRALGLYWVLLLFVLMAVQELMAIQHLLSRGATP